MLPEIECLRVEYHNQPGLPMADRLAHYLENRYVITQDQWVLNTVRRYQIFCKMHSRRKASALGLFCKLLNSWGQDHCSIFVQLLPPHRHIPTP